MKAQDTGSSSEGKTFPWRLSDTWVIAGGPVLAYFIVYTVERGFSHAWRLPAEHIKIDIITVFLITPGVLFYAAFVLWLLATLLHRLENRLARLAAVCGAHCLASVFCVLLFSAQLREWSWIGALLAVSAGLVLVCIRTTGPHPVKSPIAAPARDVFFSPDRYVCLAMSLAFAFATSFAIGYTRAQRKVRYLVYDDAPNEAVLKIYGDNIVCAGFDGTTRTLNGHYVVYAQSAKDGKSFTWKDIGPLTWRGE